jgi:hypothetical protein
MGTLNGTIYKFPPKLGAINFLQNYSKQIQKHSQVHRALSTIQSHILISSFTYMSTFEEIFLANIVLVFFCNNMFESKLARLKTIGQDKTCI